MMPRVLFLEVLPSVSGGQKVLLDLLRGGLPFEAHVLLPGPGPLGQSLERIGVFCHFAPMGRYTLVRKSWADVWRFGAEGPRLALHTWRLARRLDVDLIYANAARAFPWGTVAAWGSGRPMVWHVHNMLGDRKTLALLRSLGRLRVVERLVCVCQAANEQFGPLATKSRVIYNGVDTRAFTPAPEQGGAVREEWGLSPDRLALGIVGDLVPHKGQEVLLRAAGELARAGVPADILLVGGDRPGKESTAYVSRLRALAAQLPASCRVIFAGRRDDMPAIYNAMDVLVVAALASDTTSLALQEAMACGRVVVASRTGGIPELIAHGSNGFLVPPGSVPALAAELGALAQDGALRRSVGERARKTACAEFDLERMRAEILDEISRLLRERMPDRLSRRSPP